MGEVSGRWLNDQEKPGTTGDLVTTIAVTRRHDLTDAQWAVLEPLLPTGRRPGRPPRWNRRQLIDGIRWRVRAGVPWRDVPDVYGSWARVLTALQARADAAGLITWALASLVSD